MIKLPIHSNKNIQVNDFVMIPPYRYKFRVGGIVDKVIDGVLQRVVCFPKRQGQKLEHVKMVQSLLFIATE